jgi:hypothetical protein
MEPYTHSFEHLVDELARLDLLLRRALLISRDGHLLSASDGYRGLLITEEEVDELMRSEQLLLERGQRMARLLAPLKELDEKIAVLRRHIDERRHIAGQTGARLTLPHLAHCFGLSPAEVDLLLIALAPELIPKYETLYAYLQNDVTRKRPSVDLAFDLICRSEIEKGLARRFFSPQSPLVRHQLVYLCEESQDRKPPLLRKFLKLDDAVVSFLLGHAPESGPHRELYAPSAGKAAVDGDAALRARMENLARHLKHLAPASSVVQIVGETIEMARSGAMGLANAMALPLLLCTLGAAGESEKEATEWMAARVRDAMLSGALFAFDSSESDDGGSESLRTKVYESVFWEQIRNFRGTAILLVKRAARVAVPLDCRFIRFELAANSFASRRRNWEEALNGRSAGLDVGRLADGFRFSAGQIHQTVELATGIAALRNPEIPDPNMQDLLEAGRSLTTPHLQRFASRVEPRYTWRDIILTRDRVEQLKNIAARIKFRHRVQQEWGFGRNLSRGKGLNVLFTGPSGVGKTMAAEVLASDMALDLYEIDLSSVVSKYIGETEKNLSEIFREAESTQAMLFFDEADALFGRRTEIKDAHDRYANIEINFLLQRVEQFDGLVVLATNMQRNLDDAFLRRIHEIVEFPFPDESLRERIWRCHLPADAPRDEDIDFGFLARQFKLAGGSIKNIVVSAAYRAAQDERPIRMSDLVLATKAEHQKLGRLCVKADFGSFYELIGQ